MANTLQNLFDEDQPKVTGSLENLFDPVPPGLEREMQRMDQLYSPEVAELRKKVLIKRHTRTSRPYEEEMKVLAALQEKYGDETTTQLVDRGKNNLVRRYNKGELLKRQSQAELGYSIESSINPLVHLGHDLSTLYTGAKQKTGIGLGPIERALGLPEDYESWRKDHQAYTTADQPIAAQFAGGALPGLASAGGTTLAKGLLGQVIKNKMNTELGKQMLKEVHYTGASAGAKYLPAMQTVAAGGLYGAAQPIDPSLPKEDQLSQLLTNTIAGGAYGLGGHAIGHQIGKYGQKALTQSIKKDAQGSLPLPVDVPTPALYGHRAALDAVERGSKGSLGGKEGRHGPAREAATKIVNDFKKSIFNNFKVMNKEMTGQSNLTVGESMKYVLGNFKKNYYKSKGKMQNAYDKAFKRPGELLGDYEDLVGFLQETKREMQEELGINIQKGANRAFNQISKITNDDGLFNGKALFAKYKILNDAYATAKPADRAAINHLRLKLLDYMSNSIVGDTELVSAFRNATNMAKDHYKKFRGDQILEGYLGELKGQKYTSSDVASRIFTGKSLDQSEMPKAAALEKLINATGPGSRRLLKNEVFANLTHELGQKQAMDAIPRIRDHIISGSDTGIYTKLFNATEMKQFTDLVKAVDKIDVIDPGIPYAKARRLIDFPSWSPVQHIPGQMDRTLIRRAEQGLYGVPAEMGNAAAIPFIMESARRDQEKEVDQQILDRLGVVDKSDIVM